MPVMSKTYRKAFKWHETNGAPAAAVTVLNGRAWVLCCPLCGCMHEVRAAQTDGAYKPDCLLRRLATMPAVRGVAAGADWARVLALWEQQHPLAAAHETVWLAVEAPGTGELAAAA